MHRHTFWLKIPVLVITKRDVLTSSKISLLVPHTVLEIVPSPGVTLTNVGTAVANLATFAPVTSPPSSPPPNIKVTS